MNELRPDPIKKLIIDGLETLGEIEVGQYHTIFDEIPQMNKLKGILENLLDARYDDITGYEYTN